MLSNDSSSQLAYSLKVAAILKLSRTTVWKLTKVGCNGRKLRCIRFGRRVLVARDALEELLKKDDSVR